MWTPVSCLFYDELMYLLKIMLIYDEPLLSGQLALSCHLPRGWSLNDSSTVRQLIYREFIKILCKNFTCTKFYREGEARSPRTIPLNRTMLLKYEQMTAVYISLAETIEYLYL